MQKLTLKQNKNEKFKNYVHCYRNCAMLVSCNKEGVDETVTDITTSSEIKKKVAQRFIEEGVNPIAGVRPLVVDGVKGWVSGDIFLSDDKIADTSVKSPLQEEPGAKLFRTTNTVRINGNRRTINILGRTNLTNKMRGALRRAVGNYNDLDLRIRFSLEIGDDTSGRQIVVRVGAADGGALAQFPSGGNPGRPIIVDRALNSESSNVLTHLMMHEIGHAIGLRHSDFRIRQDCPDSGNEGFGEFGAINIPGTDDSGRLLRSVMRACFTGAESGEFIGEDARALGILY